jgi:putative ABC transport system substrate-binding protein
MRRRGFIAGLGSAAAWPLVARAQRGERIRRIGILAQGAANDPETAAHITAFVQGLQETGWSVGRNARIEHRWGTGDNALIRRYAAELIALAPDVVLAAGGQVVRPLLDLTSAAPIVFDALDPVAAGFVASLARPGGNATGFAQFDFGLCGKWLELVKRIDPSISRVAVLRDPSNSASQAQLGSIQAVASSRSVDFRPCDPRNAARHRRRGDRIDSGKVSLLTRRALDWTKRVPTIPGALNRLKVVTALLDGEIVSETSEGSRISATSRNPRRATPACNPGNSAHEAAAP